MLQKSSKRSGRTQSLTTTQQRQEVVQLVEEAVIVEARRQKACEVIGLGIRTLQSWKPSGVDAVQPDLRSIAERPVSSLWVQRFMTWYNKEHQHSQIRFVTPFQRHRGLDAAILAQREKVYAVAREKRPERWTGKTRNWEPIGTVALNPIKLSSLSEASA